MKKNVEPSKKRWLGFLAIFFSCFFFALTSLTVKIISFHFSGWLISFVRFIVGGFLAAGFIVFTGGNFRIEKMKNWVWRGVFGAFSMLLFYFGIQINSSGRATLLGDTYPVFVALFGFLFFHEKIHFRNVIGILFCMAGAVVVFYDNGRYSLIGDLLCVLSGVTGGLALQHLKKAREGNSSYLVYLSPCLIGALISSFSSRELSKISTPAEAAMLILVGILAFTGQILMTFGYKYVQATAGSIVGMSEIPLSLLVSFLFIGERMQPRFLVGAAVIIAGLIVNQMDWRFLPGREKLYVRNKNQ